ncbi:amidase [Litoreibacter roseus]|uniref:Amidase n=1 Tax=Litoreibacter roseus TaxID=2601869 RepID=A0A6N6JCL4_9RHOB|nr:amidase [Litoreibacter roseus]GFE63896.1 amidase [Litoreibacter roseus]
MTGALQAWDRHIHAFVALSEVPAGTGPLSGLTVAVKDIIDVAGLPTRNGSETCAGTPPATRDALVVQRLRAAGARILGKTTTTEYAFTDPTPCRNPHDLTRSPGGSSSGSGAAVGAGIADIALGTQTAGSLIRPAAYCGAVGFKPTAGLLPLDGVTPLARSFDTVGIIAGDVNLALRAFEVMSPSGLKAEPRDLVAICGLWDTDAEVHPDWQEALAGAKEALAGLTSQLTWRELPADVETLVAAHRTVMCAEAYASHRALLRDDKASLLGPKFLAGLEAGRAVSEADLSGARQVLAEARQAFWNTMSGTELILTLPVPDGAPLLGDTTGFQDWLTPWTVFGGPLICLPWGHDDLARPQSIMLAAHPGQDLFLLSVVAHLERHAPPIPAPRLPS